ncbi:DUF3795 domain-containing protein [Desulfovibrio aminophilus]|jgi:hypothetical protein|uniref:DUF3795 domain-containing protein n=1 Tax=Desulfovibrio aminophilus TaxID=81425 RepID=UPI003392860B
MRRAHLARLAPCGLNCGGCLAFSGGPVQEAAQSLIRALGPDFAPYAERFTAMNPVFADYPAFARLLEFLGHGSCGGCRQSGCLFQACGVHACIRDKGLDFCFQCDDFPCDAHGLPPALAERWRTNNERMREEGPEAYWLRIKDTPRYP